MKIVKTTLKPLYSKSLQNTSTSVSLAQSANSMNGDALTAAVRDIRVAQMIAPCQESSTLDIDERNHVNRAVEVALTSNVTGCGFVRNTSTGDVGIAHGASYAYKPSDNTAASDTSAASIVFEDDEGTHKRIYLHVTVALPNGNFTTWSVGNIERLGDRAGMIAFRSIYTS